MRIRRSKVSGGSAVYHCMSRVVNGERLFKQREKEVLRKMIWQVADFCGVEVLTYCVMSNHFHVLMRVPKPQLVSDQELMRRYRILYPKPTKYQVESVQQMELDLAAGGEEAEAIRKKLLARMGDVSEYMKSVKQRFSVWYNRSHRRYGTLWAERFKSVLVEGKGTPLQTMAAYIDLNPVRAGLVKDPKAYRFCGYAEAVAGNDTARRGLLVIWRDYLGVSGNVGRNGIGQDGSPAIPGALKAHRMLIFGKGSDPWSKGCKVAHRQALKVLEEEQGELPRAAMLRCRVRYFTDGAVLGSAEFVRGFIDAWQVERERKHPPKVHELRGKAWGDLAVIRALRNQVYG